MTSKAPADLVNEEISRVDQELKALQRELADTLHLNDDLAKNIEEKVIKFFVLLKVDSVEVFNHISFRCWTLMHGMAGSRASSERGAIAISSGEESSRY